MEKLVLAAGRKEIAALGEDIRFVVEPYIPHGTGSGPQGQGAQGQAQGQGQALSTQQLAHLSDPTYSSVLHGVQDSLARAPYHALTCPHGDLLSFWSKTTEADRLYVTPYLAQPSPASGSYGSFSSSASLHAHTSTDTSTPNIPAPTKYVTFEPDPGGWNNIRMQMELVVVFAYATGRTLVLPPDQPMYLLNKGKGHQKVHSFADFFPFELIQKRVSVISMEQYLALEGVTGHLFNTTTGLPALPPGNKTAFDATIKEQKLSMWGYLRDVSECPLWKAMKVFVVIPPAPGVNVTLLPADVAGVYRRRLEEFGAGREARYYDQAMHDKRSIHFISLPGKGYRILEHFYTFLHFQDPAMDRYYKRFVRDYVHYIDVIFCKSALIINALRTEGGTYSAFHIRRGEFQYKEVKIPASNMLQNVGHFVPQKLLFIATDEKNKSFFDPFKKDHTVRFLDDYMDLAQLRHINPNFLGMIDQVVCTRGDIFVGTWFSTFSGYITRMRGYMGYQDSSVFYGDKKHRDRFQKPELPMFPFYMREWNVSWDKIDIV
ncbi:GDP-fucose protein O-fucosyltransferase-domain-containing protein [Ochromonadaceae sp. CCMP2298]|nr:GDP-fucose protein O-fucosyltransferase-domain-containing protein [Ochromonadaceae sp. CCMP2298]